MSSVEPVRPVSVTVESPWRRVSRFLYTQNPFYLLSVGFVLHSTRFWFDAGGGRYNPWPLMGIIGGYILLIAATGYVLVRFGRVWDDARSIFLILLLLFVELSLTFDDALIRDRPMGTALLLGGLALSALVSEGLMLGLRINLPVLFRVPYHLLLALLFLYPLWIVAAFTRNPAAATWRIFWFSTVAGAVLLSLLPAIRRGAEYTRRNGTPWRWPCFPWTLFGFLAICIGLRAYALSLSFDPALSQPRALALQMESAFGGYFVVPLLLAVAVLLLEMGLMTPNLRLQRIALLIPLVCVVLAFPSTYRGGPYSAFLADFMAQAGSPISLAVFATMAWYVYAYLRGVRAAEKLIVAALLALSVTGPQTISLQTLVAPQPIPIAVAAAAALYFGLRLRNSGYAFAAVLFAVVAFRSGSWGGLHSTYRDIISAHILGAGALAIGIVYRDEFARLLQMGGAWLLPAACVVALIRPIELPADFPMWIIPVYQTVLTVISFACAYGLPSFAYFVAGIISMTTLAVTIGNETYRLLRALTNWEGLGYFLIGMLWFILAVLLSAFKTGLGPRIVALLPRPPSGTNGSTSSGPHQP